MKDPVKSAPAHVWNEFRASLDRDIEAVMEAFDDHGKEYENSTCLKEPAPAGKND